MSWSPSPYDDEWINKHQGSSKFANMTEVERAKAMESALPSVRAGRPHSHHRKTKKKSRKKSGIARSSISQVGVELSDLNAERSVAMAEDDLEDLDIETLKELPYPMHRKKELRKRLLQYNEYSTRSTWQRKSGQRWKRFKENAAETIRVCELWRSSIHEIEGRFGNGIRSYFAFLRWLFLLNVYIFTLVFFFICVPTIIFENVDSNSTTTSTFNSTEQCEYDPYDASAVQPFQQYIIWWFTGQGFMENTLLFYGYYENTVNSIATSNFEYNLPLAYVLVAFSYFFLSLALIVRRAGVGVKEAMLSGENRHFQYCNQVFAGWDFCITNQKAAELKHLTIKNELQADLEEQRTRLRQRSRSRKQKAKLYTKRFIINLLVFVMLGGSLAGIYFAADYALRNSSTFDNQPVVDLLVQYMVSIVITFANFLAPLMFGILVEYEDYSPAFALKFTLVRTVILRLVSVMFLYIVVYFQINCNDYGFIDTQYLDTCGYCDGMPCWETYMGQEMYKLTILDFFIVLAVTLFVEFPRRLLVDLGKFGMDKSVGHQSFHLPSSLLSLIYSQTLMWIGAFYSPLLPAIVVIKFFIFFYLKKLTLIYNCKPNQRPYRASRGGTFFFIILMFGFVVAAIPVGVSLAVIPPSQYCGPFRGLATMFSIVSATINTFPGWLSSILHFLGSAGFAFIVGVILCLILYYYVALNSAHRKRIKLLKDQLAMEGRDKQFLMKRLTDMHSSGSGQVKSTNYHAKTSRERRSASARVRTPSRTNRNLASCSTVADAFPEVPVSSHKSSLVSSAPCMQYE